MYDKNNNKNILFKIIGLIVPCYILLNVNFHQNLEFLFRVFCFKLYILNTNMQVE